MTVADRFKCFSPKIIFQCGCRRQQCTHRFIKFIVRRLSFIFCSFLECQRVPGYKGGTGKDAHRLSSGCKIFTDISIQPCLNLTYMPHPCICLLPSAILVVGINSSINSSNGCKLFTGIRIQPCLNLTLHATHKDGGQKQKPFLQLFAAFIS